MWNNIDSNLYIGSNLKLSSLILCLKKFSHKIFTILIFTQGSLLIIGFGKKYIYSIALQDKNSQRADH